MIIDRFNNLEVKQKVSHLSNVFFSRLGQRWHYEILIKIKQNYRPEFQSNSVIIFLIFPIQILEPLMENFPNSSRSPTGIQVRKAYEGFTNNSERKEWEKKVNT